MKLSFPAEWEEQDAIMLAWPHEDTDWSLNLNEVVQTYIQIVEVIAKHQLVILLTKDLKIKNLFSKDLLQNILILEADYNDTWTRDYIGISVIKNNTPTLVNFNFNGWGNKYPSGIDNSVNSQLFKNGILQTPMLDASQFTLEGGSVDSNGKGTILTTTKCLLNKNRNPNETKASIEETLKNYLGVSEIIWIENGEIEGDDTDAHIDTLIRYCNHETIAYSIDSSESLIQMELELKTKCPGLNLVSLPLPQPIIYQNRQLPATYANFLITNELVLAPTYGDPNDQIAINKLQSVFKTRQVIGIDCIELIKENGSLHCITMQIAKGVLNLSL